MAEPVKGLKGKLTLKKLLFKDDGETRRTWEKDGKVYFLEFVKFDVSGKEYSGECMTTKKEGSAWEEGKEYSFDFKEADNPQYNHRIFNIKDPNAPAGNFGGGGGKGNYETAAERAQRQKFIIAQSSMERAIEILGVGKSVEEYKPLADMIFAYVLDKGGELKEAAASAVDLPKLEGAPLQGILNFVAESVTQKSINEGAAKLVKVLFGIQRYELTDASVITIAKKLLEPIYSAPAQSNSSSSDITTIAGSHGAIENEGSDDLPF